jgi:hypothetical protein
MGKAHPFRRVYSSLKRISTVKTDRTARRGPGSAVPIPSQLFMLVIREYWRTKRETRVRKTTIGQQAPFAAWAVNVCYKKKRDRERLELWEGFAPEHHNLMRYLVE